MLGIPGQVHTGWTIGLGVAALGLGIAFGRVSAKDMLERGRRLMAVAVKYERRADTHYALVRALTEPTTAVPIVELVAATRTRPERLWAWAVAVGERVRDGFTTIPAPPDWQPGEMLAAANTPEVEVVEVEIVEDENTMAIFNRLVAEYNTVQDSITTLPAQSSPWVHPLAVRGPVPEIVHAPREIQAPPRWETRQAPVPMLGTPSRARARRSEDGGLTGRERVWNGALLGPVPKLEMPPFPRPFLMPQVRRPMPADPRRMAALPQDETRQYRVKVVAP